MVVHVVNQPTLAIQTTCWKLSSGGRRGRLLSALVGKPGVSTLSEDKEVAHASFVKANLQSKPDFIKVPGLQEFASAVWERRRRIPSTTYQDPLDRLFSEFDKDCDGHLTATEVASALQSRGVELTEEVAQLYIEAVDLNSNHEVEREEFAELVYCMAKADLVGELPKPKVGVLKRGKSLLELPVFQTLLEEQPALLNIPGLQEYAWAVWDRRRRIPSSVWKDPLEMTFREFDRDADGHLTAEELVAALGANGVQLTLEQAQLFIDAVDADGNSTLELDEFPGLVYGLASLDRLSRAAE